MRLADAFLYARILVMRRLPDGPVRRRVQGVELLMPRRHLLPVFARPGSPYGQNLVDLARGLGSDEPLCFLDVGANIGDSTRQVLDAVPGSAVCVEPDPEWLPYLEHNVADLGAVEIERSILLGEGADTSLVVVHESDGSSRLARAEAGDAPESISTDELLRRHPMLTEVRLVKTDTDGYDVMLTPELARTFSGSHPVIFLEFDPRQTALATPELDPVAVWTRLEELGYTHALVWDNGGRVLWRGPVSELPARSAVFDQPARERGFSYWDVAVAHREDQSGQRVLADLGAAG